MRLSLPPPPLTAPLRILFAHYVRLVIFISACPAEIRSYMLAVVCVVVVVVVPPPPPRRSFDLVSGGSGRSGRRLGGLPVFGGSPDSSTAPATRSS